MVAALTVWAQAQVWHLLLLTIVFPMHTNSYPIPALCTAKLGRLACLDGLVRAKLHVYIKDVLLA